MRRLLVAVIVVVLFLWGGLWVASLLMRTAVGSGPENAWPLGLGALSDVSARYPDGEMSAGAAQLVALALPLGVDIAPRTADAPPRQPQPMEFVRGQLAKWVDETLRNPTPAIEPLPSEAGEYLAGRAAHVTAIVTLLSSAEPIVWEQNLDAPATPIPNLIGHMQLYRILVGRALDRSRAGDAGAWNDLLAAWHLSRSLTTRPEIIANLIALAIARGVEGAARKLPLPAPEWLGEVHSFDFRRALIASFQADAQRINEHVYAETTVDGGPLMRRAVDAVMAPYTRMAASNVAEQWRQTAIEVAGLETCDLDVEAFNQRRRALVPWWNLPARQMTTPNLSMMWQRERRFAVEREATVRALALREGSPPQPQSQCSDGQWLYTPDGRGFRFNREIDIPGQVNPIPLEFSTSDPSPSA